MATVQHLAVQGGGSGGGGAGDSMGEDAHKLHVALTAIFNEVDTQCVHPCIIPPVQHSLFLRFLPGGGLDQQ